MNAHEVAELERSASRIREFQPAYVLRYLRSPRYLNAVYPTEPPDAIAARAAHSREALARRDCSFEFVMTEAAVRTTLASAEVHLEQIDYLLHLADRPALRLGIIPWRQRMTEVVGHAFHLYDDRAVMIGHATGRIVITDVEQVRRYETIFHALSGDAVYGPDAAAELARVRRSFDRADERRT